MNNYQNKNKNNKEKYDNLLIVKDEKVQKWWEKWKFLYRTAANVPPPPFINSNPSSK